MAFSNQARPHIAQDMFWYCRTSPKCESGWCGASHSGRAAVHSSLPLIRTGNRAIFRKWRYPSSIRVLPRGYAEGADTQFKECQKYRHCIIHSKMGLWITCINVRNPRLIHCRRKAKPGCHPGLQLQPCKSRITTGGGGGGGGCTLELVQVPISTAACYRGSHYRTTHPRTREPVGTVSQHTASGSRALCFLLLLLFKWTHLDV